METLILDSEHLDLSRVSKNIRNEVNRGQRENVQFREISQTEHETQLRAYRKRKSLLMPPFVLKEKRTYYGLFTADGIYCCSLALYPFDGYLVIQGVSIAADCPYFAFSYLIYRCLQLSLDLESNGLDLAGEGVWKHKWNPKPFTNSFKPGRSLTGGRISGLLAKLYWFFKKN